MSTDNNPATAAEPEPEFPAYLTPADLDWLRTRRLFVATPMYAMGCSGDYNMAAIMLNTTLIRYGITHTFSHRADSLIPRGRNWLADQFYNRNFTDILLWDSDISFQAEDVVRMLALSRTYPGILTGPYAKKIINWNRIARAASNPSIHSPIEFMPAVGSELCMNFIVPSQMSLEEPQEIIENGTGWMLVPRYVFENLIREGAVRDYKLMPEEVKDYDGRTRVWAFFEGLIDGDRERHFNLGLDAALQAIADPTVRVKLEGLRKPEVDDYYLSEDWYFCRRWRSIGGKVWTCLWMKSKHIGTYAYPADMPALAQATGGEYGDDREPEPEPQDGAIPCPKFR